jgi:hypothetical protein
MSNRGRGIHHIHHKPVLWFSAGFLIKPWAGWTVDWDQIDYTMWIREDEQYEGRKYMAGVYVKHELSGQVWRLTGETRGEFPNEQLEGRWPD